MGVAETVGDEAASGTASATATARLASSMLISAVALVGEEARGTMTEASVVKRKASVAKKTESTEVDG